MREFLLDRVSGKPRQNTVALTPDAIRLNGTPMFATLINANEGALLRGDFDLKADLIASFGSRHGGQGPSRVHKPRFVH